MAVHHMLTCKQLVELVTDYLEGSLSEQDRLRFEVHLEGCDGCRNYLQQIKRTINLLGTLTEDTLLEDAKNELLEVFRDWRRN